MTSTAVAGRRPNLTVTGLLAGFAALAPLSIDMFLPAVPKLSAELTASAEQSTATVSVFLAGVALGQLLAGPLSDRIGRRAPVIGGLAVFLAGALLAAVAPSIQVLLAARLTQALGASSVSVTGRAIVRDLFDHKGVANFLSTLALISGLAPVLAPAGGSAVLGAFGWRAIFLCTAVFGVLLLAGAALRLPESRSKEAESDARARHPFATMLILLQNRRLVAYLLGAAFNSAGFFTYLASAPLVIMKVYEVHPAQFSGVIALNAVGLVGASQLNRLLLRRYSPDAVLRAMSAVSAINALAFGALAVTGVGGLPVLLVLVFAAVSSTSIVQANTMAGALSVDPRRAGSIAALFGAAGFAAGTVASMVAGFLYDGTERGMTIVIGASLLGVCIALRALTSPSRAAQASG